jgi:hypothetical protein
MEETTKKTESRRDFYKTNPYSEDDPWMEDIRLSLRELHEKVIPFTVLKPLD